jgi:hypothetical protein
VVHGFDTRNSDQRRLAMRRNGVRALAGPSRFGGPSMRRVLHRSLKVQVPS